MKGGMAESETIRNDLLMGSSRATTEGPRLRRENPESTRSARSLLEARILWWFAGKPHAQRGRRALGEVTLLTAPGLRPNRRVSTEAP